MKISNERWKEAQGAEKAIQDGDLADLQRAMAGRIVDRHKQVMKLSDGYGKGLKILDLGGGAVSMLLDYPIQLGVRWSAIKVC